MLRFWYKYMWWREMGEKMNTHAVTGDNEPAYKGGI